VGKIPRNKMRRRFGVFSVRPFRYYMSLIYGEGRESAFRRLQRKIYKVEMEKLHAPWSNVTQSLSHQNGCWMFIPPASMLMAELPPQQFDEKMLVMTASQYEHLEEHRLICHRIHYPDKFAKLCFESKSEYVRKRMESWVLHCGWLAKTIGVLTYMIVSVREQESTATIYMRWPLRMPLGFGLVFTGKMTFHKLFPSLPKVALSRQDLIPCNSRIVSACLSEDILELRQILMAKEAHPKTPSTLYVTAIPKSCSCSWSTVQTRIFTLEVSKREPSNLNS
jgi:hypothetical protein